uniref:Uncharacterized protein n=1 Tax=Anguilla anguilla TaxID=7936 RepID=A0A0E9WFS3_ANGAN
MTLLCLLFCPGLSGCGLSNADPHGSFCEGVSVQFIVRQTFRLNSPHSSSVKPACLVSDTLRCPNVIRTLDERYLYFLLRPLVLLCMVLIDLLLFQPTLHH